MSGKGKAAALTVCYDEGMSQQATENPSLERAYALVAQAEDLTQLAAKLRAQALELADQLQGAKHAER